MSDIDLSLATVKIELTPADIVALKRAQKYRLALFGAPFALYLYGHLTADIVQNWSVLPWVLLIPLALLVAAGTVCLVWGVRVVLRPYPDDYRLLLLLDEKGMTCKVRSKDVLKGAELHFFEYQNIARIYEALESNGGGAVWQVLNLDTLDKSKFRMRLYGIDPSISRARIVAEIARRAGLSRRDNPKRLIDYIRPSQEM